MAIKDFERLERQLNKRLAYPYVWGRKQSNDWDKKTNFIYKTYTVKAVLEKSMAFSEELKHYALTRWFNYQSAMGVETIFATHENVTPNKNQFDRMEDFKIDDISFDHKTSVFPKGFNKSLEYSKQNEAEMIKWFYKEQSPTKRNLNQNRLFIVLYDSVKGEHWKMKANMNVFRDEIDTYMKNFKKENLHKISFDTGETALSSVLWIER